MNCAVTITASASQRRRSSAPTAGYVTTSGDISSPSQVANQRGLATGQSLPLSCRVEGARRSGGSHPPAASRVGRSSNERSPRSEAGSARHRSSAQRLHQACRVVSTHIDDAVDEDSRGAAHLRQSESGLYISADAPPDVRPYPILLETCDVQTKLLGVLPEIVVLERLLPQKEQLVHGPEAVLQGSCLSGGGRPERVRMDLDEWEVPKGETNAPAEFLLDTFDSPKRLPGVGALVVPVLQNQACGRWPAGVVDLLVQWHQTRPGVLRQPRLQVSRPPRRNRHENEDGVDAIASAYGQSAQPVRHSGGYRHRFELRRMGVRHGAPQSPAERDEGPRADDSVEDHRGDHCRAGTT